MPTAAAVDGDSVPKEVSLMIDDAVDGPVLRVSNASNMPAAGVLRTSWWSEVVNESPEKHVVGFFLVQPKDVLSIRENGYSTIANGLDAPIVQMATLELYPGHRNQLIMTRPRGGGMDRLYLIYSDVPRSCRVIRGRFPQERRPADGAYFIQPTGFLESPRAVYCDMQMAGGLNHTSPSVNLTGASSPTARKLDGGPARIENGFRQ